MITNPTVDYAPQRADFLIALPRSQSAPCWKSEHTARASELQNLLDNAQNGDYSALDQKLKDYIKENHFFRLTEGKFYEVTPGDFKDVKVKVQVKEGTITWYFSDIGHDETTQEFRNLIFRSAALGHVLVPDACVKYYRGTNAMHVRRMHTSEEESKINHNHYRVHDDHVTVDQFRQHLMGFVQAEKAYGIDGKFLSEDEANAIIEKYKKYDERMDEKHPNYPDKTRREVYHEQELAKWTNTDIEEYLENKKVEEPCAAEEIIISLNQPITVESKTEKELTIIPKDWPKYLDKFDKNALNLIAKAGSAGLKSEIAQTRQIEGSVLQARKNAYTRIGELFEQHHVRNYPPLEQRKEVA